MILKEQFTKFQATEAKLEKMNLRLERLKKRYDKLYNSQRWVKKLIEPLAKEMCNTMGFKYWETLGPFGLGSEVSIWLYNTKEERKNCKVHSLTLRPDLNNPDNPFGVMIKDYLTKDKTYDDNSIGARNGFNYPSITPPADATLEWFINNLSKPE